MLLLADILVGVAEERVAEPPVIEKTKSSFSSAPLPLLVLNTASSNVTAIVLLSDASCTSLIVGGISSFALIE